MPMKAKDCAVATALVINGFLRANEDVPGDPNQILAAALGAIRGECNDWGENLSSNNAALEPAALNVELHEANGGFVSRSPYNLLSAAVALASEAIDLNGPEVVAQLICRLEILRAREEAPDVAVLSGELPTFPSFTAPISEERLEREVSRLVDRADAVLMASRVTQAQYDAWSKALDAWSAKQPTQAVRS